MTWEEAVLWLRAQPDKKDLVLACFYDDPLPAAAERYYLSTEWTDIRRYLPKIPGTALDLGAGRGIASYAMARDGWQVVAIEPDSSPVVGSVAIRHLASETGLAIEVQQEWGERLPFPDQTFDLFFARQSLHHSSDLETLCQEARRVLRPGGAFVAVREHVISRKADLPKFLASHPLHRLYGGERAYLLSEYTSAIQRAGIRLTKVINPYESNMNLYPNTIEDIVARLAARWRLASPKAVPRYLLTLWGAIIQTPGRLFSFVGEAP